MITNLPGEQWVPIKGYEGYYEISNMGRVKALARKVKAKSSSYIILPEEIRLNRLNNQGYVRLNFSKNRVVEHLNVHRLVAYAFIPLIPDKPFINHKNGIRHDNRVDNLEWCTTAENVLHGFRSNGRIHPHKNKFGALHCTSKPVIATNIKTKEEIFSGSGLLFADTYLVNVNGIYSVLKGRQKSASGYVFRYATEQEILHFLTL